VVPNDASDASELTVLRTLMRPHPITPQKVAPSHIRKPSYAVSGVVSPYSPLLNTISYHDEDSIQSMKEAARLARRMLDLACSLAHPGVTTDEIDTAIHDAILEVNAYPSPLNYQGFPKSSCSSVNEVVCHGIPDTRPLRFGDVVSFDVSCFLNGVHGDNCATVIVGDCQSEDEIGRDWRGVPYRKHFENESDEAHFVEARRLVQATREGLYAGIEACRPGGCLTEIGAAIHDVADRYGYDTVRNYRGHGICSEFHCPPFVSHCRNSDVTPLKPGMIFTIEPMFAQGNQDNEVWADNWTIVTKDKSLAAQFEHTVLITDSGVDIITIPDYSE